MSRCPIDSLECVPRAHATNGPTNRSISHHPSIHNHSHVHVSRLVSIVKSPTILPLHRTLGSRYPIDLQTCTIDAPFLPFVHLTPFHPPLSVFGQCIQNLSSTFQLRLAFGVLQSLARSPHHPPALSLHPWLWKKPPSHQHFTDTPRTNLPLPSTRFPTLTNSISFDPLLLDTQVRVLLPPSTLFIGNSPTLTIPKVVLLLGKEGPL